MSKPTFASRERSKFATELLYADKHRVPADLLIGFIYQAGGYRRIRKKLKAREMAHYFTADTHFGDDQIRSFFARPFATGREMDAAMLAACQVIAPEDDLWIIGDFACSDTDAQRADAAATFQALPGHKHLICGNHDSDWVKYTLPWVSVDDLVELDADGCRLVLCHYPLVTWHGAQEGVIHLFGHVHTNWPGARGQVNVGVDLWGFRPITTAEAELRALLLPRSKLHDRVEGLRSPE